MKWAPRFRAAHFIGMHTVALARDGFKPIGPGMFRRQILLKSRCAGIMAAPKLDARGPLMISLFTREERNAKRQDLKIRRRRRPDEGEACRYPVVFGWVK